MPTCRMMAPESAFRRVVNTSCRMNGTPLKSIHRPAKKASGPSPRACRRGSDEHLAASRECGKSIHPLAPTSAMDVHRAQLARRDRSAGCTHGTRSSDNENPIRFLPARAASHRDHPHHENAAGCLRGRRRPGARDAISGLRSRSARHRHRRRATRPARRDRSCAR